MKHIFFDFDGVISPFTPQVLSENAITPLTSPGGFDISYLNTVVSWMNDLAAQDDVQLYWLTTWTKKLHHLAPTGVPEDMINIVPLQYVSVHKWKWKREAGIAKAKGILESNSDDIVVWIDDEERINGGVDGVVSINPNQYIGLKQEEMDYIESL